MTIRHRRARPTSSFFTRPTSRAPHTHPRNMVFARAEPASPAPSRSPASARPITGFFSPGRAPGGGRPANEAAIGRRASPKDLRGFPNITRQRRFEHRRRPPGRADRPPQPRYRFRWTPSTPRDRCPPTHPPHRPGLGPEIRHPRAVRRCPHLHFSLPPPAPSTAARPSPRSGPPATRVRYPTDPTCAL